MSGFKFNWTRVALLALSVGVILPATTMASSAQSRSEFCQQSRDPNYFQDLANSIGNLIGFENPAGSLNIGLCWWHSELQRSSFYLTVYHPQAPKPTQSEATALFEAIMKKQKVVDVPGYANFEEFTSDWKNLLTDLLSQWQVTQGILSFGFIQGLASSTVSASSLQHSMDVLYGEVEGNKNVVFEVLKMPGVMTHAWLVTHVKPITNGYELSILDSNIIGEQTYRYTRGMTHFAYSADDSAFVPYLHRQSDLQDYKRLIRQYCGR